MTAPATVCPVAVDPDLARRLATAGRKSEEWRARRDQLIVQAHQNGASLREIARVVGMSNPGVLRVIRRGDLVMTTDPDGTVQVREVVEESSAPPEDIWDGPAWNDDD